ncbi:MAG: cell envelope integrity protein TolA [Ectothiorhodospiraceae bacterium AqS1]|nr:cell envelope integrity protein TolA [Ectothiorhodospiraceae bacterium AqS1]MBF2759630.1 cell envelope integrity protein TolA [Ectothiorhodospiraceae bacterium AqS1]
MTPSIALATILIAGAIFTSPWMIRPAKAEWEFVSRIDPIDDTKWAYAYATSAYDWKGDRSLFIVCTTDRSIEIRIDWMEYIGGSERPVIYRFDHDKADSDLFWTHETITGWDLNNNKEGAAVVSGAGFLQRLAASERFVARVQDFDFDTHTHIFDTKGFDRVLPSLLEYCPDYHPPTEAERQAAMIARQEAARQTAELARQQAEEELRSAELSRQRAEAERARIEAERRRIEAARQRAEEGRRAAELARQRAERERQNIKTTRQRAEEERLAAILARQQAAEERLLPEEERITLAEAIRSEDERIERESAALIEAARKRYVDAIRLKIEAEWVKPPGTPDGLLCVVKVEQLPGGEIVSVEVLKSSGDSLFDRSVEAAVRAAGMLPAPSDPSIFDREIVITFAPEA